VKRQGKKSKHTGTVRSDLNLWTRDSPEAPRREKLSLLSIVFPEESVGQVKDGRIGGGIKVLGEGVWEKEEEADGKLIGGSGKPGARNRGSDQKGHLHGAEEMNIARRGADGDQTKAYLRVEGLNASLRRGRKLTSWARLEERDLDGA